MECDVNLHVVSKLMEPDSMFSNDVRDQRHVDREKDRPEDRALRDA